jgi:hypothetical protein
MPSSSGADMQRRHSKISRAGSLKNSRRQLKKSNNLNSLKHQHTILSSYLPGKNFMGSDINDIKPVRQMQNEKKRTLKSSTSDRQRLRTAKNGRRSNSNEKFDDFVIRMKKDKPNENTYGIKQRPYTSNGYGPSKIKNQKSPNAKSKIGVNNYDKVRNYPSSQNRSYVPSHIWKKQTNRIIGYKPSLNILNESDSRWLDHRKTFYPTSSNSLANNTTSSNDASTVHRVNQIKNTYGHIGKT